MKNFESFLASQMNDFIAYRQGLGYNIEASRAPLLVFDRYLRQTNADWHALKSSYFLEMRANLEMEPSSINHLFSSLRGFFNFLLRREEVLENPLLDIPRLKENTVVPFVLSPEQIGQLLQVLCRRVRRNEKYFLTDLAVYLTVLLLARCGMRISEPLMAMKHHYRKDDGTLYIERTKFKKQRLIALPKAVMIDMDNYLTVRKSFHPHDQNPFLLAGKDHGPLSCGRIEYVFHQAMKKIGLDQRRRVIGNMNFTQPAPHCLRHAFAVNTLIRIKERGESAQSALPVLAAYMGHSKYQYTSVYLKVADAMSRKNLVDFSLWQQKIR
jgi:integrase/recombinase XerD